MANEELMNSVRPTQPPCPQCRQPMDYIPSFNGYYCNHCKANFNPQPLAPQGPAVDGTRDRKGKIDQGRCWNYWKLSYRRKFQRNLWMLPINLLMIPIVYFLVFETHLLFVTGLERAIFTIVIVLAFIFSIVQTVYTYVMWKREGQELLLSSSTGP